MTNLEIAKLLRNVAAAYSVINEKKHYFQIVAYQKAADTIEHTTAQVADLLRENKLDELPGVGTSIKQHLEELIKTGHVKHFDAVLKNVPEAMFPLLDVPSFGPKKAYKLVKEFDLKNPKTVIADLHKLAESGKIAPLEGFGEKSQSDIMRAFDEFKKGAGKTTRMLLPFANELAEKLLEYLKKDASIKEAYPLGSLRRKVATVGDLDIAVSTTEPAKAIEHFVSYPYKERIIEKGPNTASILTSGGHQVDLMTQPPDAFGSLLQHFTGSKHHNVHLRDIALKKGLSLSEYGIKKVGQEKRTLYKTEEDFYSAIGMEWIPPEMREDTGEIELAQKHKLPKLVEVKDIKGDLHIHSSYPIEPSHDLGVATMEEMLKKAKELGYSYLGFSEHNPSVSKHTKEQMNTVLRKRYEHIQKLKESKKYIHIINLLETDILPSGELAINEESFQYLDATIVSIHSSFGMKKDEMTKRVLKGLSNPKAKILAHPTGRMLNERPGFELDFEKIFNFCVENHKALEINASPERMDLPDSIIRMAVEKGVKMVIDTDSHDLTRMDMMQYGVWNARRGWATKNDILNTLEYNEFVQWLKK
ncbi:MAG TPA: PHP domain-containing protein [Patescibacteria group bacterium]